MDHTEAGALDQALGDELRGLRAKRNLTRAQLAEMAGVSAKTIQRLEEGTRSMSVALLYALSGALDIDPHRMVTNAREELARRGRDTPATE